MALTKLMLVLTQKRGPEHVFRRLGQVVALLSMSVAQLSMDGTLGVTVALLKHSLNVTLMLRPVTQTHNGGRHICSEGLDRLWHCSA